MSKNGIPIIVNVVGKPVSQRFSDETSNQSSFTTQAITIDFDTFKICAFIRPRSPLPLGSYSASEFFQKHHWDGSGDQIKMHDFFDMEHST